MNLDDNPNYKRALDYIAQHDLTALTPGQHLIDGDRLWVNIAEVTLKPAAEAKFEVHDRYIDIQIPLTGTEQYGVKPRRACQRPIGDFNAEDDYLLFDDPVEQVVTRHKGEMIVFTPDDAHAPLIGAGALRKAIFKVKVEAQK
ncbi:MAG: YhcH/YjgK/YiaL family protein [Bacteroidales bacterium]|nr:YhcH/YjgK/YiaL family protein [Candidatus Equimonas enterica]